MNHIKVIVHEKKKKQISIVVVNRDVCELTKPPPDLVTVRPPDPMMDLDFFQ